jgi:hypothetical protein
MKRRFFLPPKHRLAQVSGRWTWRSARRSARSSARQSSLGSAQPMLPHVAVMSVRTPSVKPGAKSSAKTSLASLSPLTSNTPHVERRHA